MENLGMSPVIVIVPGHAFTGVRLGPNSSEILYLDLTVLPRGTFAQAVSRADGYMKGTPTEKILTVDVATTRKMGIYPLPSPRAAFVTAAQNPEFAAPPSQTASTPVAGSASRKASE
jgi:hypothetical protein